MRAFFHLLAATLASTAIACFGEVCDISWDGQEIAEGSNGLPLSTPVILRRHGNSPAEVTVEQMAAFFEAKEAISQQLGRNPIYIICDGDEPNAFAFKTDRGDVVGVTVGMMRLVDGDRDMAAEVIGHEYAHLLRNHGAAGEARQGILDLIGLVAGLVLDYKMQKETGRQGMGMELGQLGATLVSRKFSRDQEREADQLGFDYMVNAGFNPKGAIRLAEKMKALGTGRAGAFLSSHPGWNERSQRFTAMIESSNAAKQIVADTGSYTTLLSAENGRLRNLASIRGAFSSTRGDVGPDRYCNLTSDCRQGLLCSNNRCSSDSMTTSTASIQNEDMFSQAGIGIRKNDEGLLEVVSKSMKRHWRSTLQIGDKITHCGPSMADSEAGRRFGYYDVRSVADVESHCGGIGAITILFRVSIGADGFAYRSLMRSND